MSEIKYSFYLLQNLPLLAILSDWKRAFIFVVKHLFVSTMKTSRPMLVTRSIWLCLCFAAFVEQ